MILCFVLSWPTNGIASLLAIRTALTCQPGTLSGVLWRLSQFSPSPQLTLIADQTVSYKAG